jgi:hypothetical protein
MSAPNTDNQVQTQPEQKQNDKELNFRRLEEKYKHELMLERQLRLDLEQKIKAVPHDEDDDDNEPYVDKKKLNKTLAKHGQQFKQETQSEIQRAVQTAITEERQQNWVKQNSDFHDVLKHAQKLYEHDQELAETILEMPESFERQKLVYKNIKALGLHKEAPRQQSIQEKVDANRRSPYYQPSGVGAAPYSGAGDFSPAGQKQAYEKMQQLKAQLRI